MARCCCANTATTRVACVPLPFGAGMSQRLPQVYPLATHWEGKRLSSPNDLVEHPSGTIFFTDPPFGLKGFSDSPLREPGVNGVYRRDPNGRVRLIDGSLTRPNGIGLSPAGDTLYVACSDPNHPVFVAYDLDENLEVTSATTLRDKGTVRCRSRGQQRRHEHRQRRQPLCHGSWRCVDIDARGRTLGQHPHRTQDRKLYVWGGWLPVHDRGRPTAARTNPDPRRPNAADHAIALDPIATRPGIRPKTREARQKWSRNQNPGRCSNFWHRCAC